LKSRLAITGALFLLVVWSIYWVTDYFSAGITRDASGNVVDPYSRATDLLHTVLPLLTIALGYWFGVAGKDRAEAAAVVAQDRASAAELKLTAVVDASTESDLLKKARADYPEAFKGG